MFFNLRTILAVILTVLAGKAAVATPPKNVSTSTTFSLNSSGLPPSRAVLLSSSVGPFASMTGSDADPCRDGRLQISAGQLVSLTIDHGDTPVVLSVTSPEGKPVLELTSVSNLSLHALFVTPTSGEYGIELLDSLTKRPAAPCRCPAFKTRKAKPDDGKLIDAAALINEAGNLAWRETSDELEESDRKYAAALSLFRSLDQHDRPARALLVSTLSLRGRVLNDLNNSQGARPYLERAVKAARVTGDKAVEVATLVEMGRCYLALGETSRASESIDSAWAAAQSSKDSYAQASAVKALAELHYELNDYRKGVDYAREEVGMFERLPDRRGYAHALIMLGLVESDLNNSDRAGSLYTQAISTSKAINYQAGLADALTYTGHLSAKEGRLQEAIGLYIQAEEFSQRLGDKLRESWVTSGLGYVYDQIGDAERALQYYQRTLKLRLAAHNLPAEASIYRRLGAEYFFLRDYSQASLYLEKAVPLYEGFKQWRYLAATLRDLGQVQEALGEYKKAANYYTRATQLAAKAEDTRGSAYLLVAQGRMREQKGELAKALRYYNEGLKLHRAAKDPRGESEALFHLGHILAKCGQLERARGRLEESIQTDEKFRTRIQGPDLRASYLADIRKHYESYIDVLMQLHRSSPGGEFDLRALEASERGRARSFLETLSEAGVDIRQGVDRHLLDREGALQKQINAQADRQMQLLNTKHAKEEAQLLANEIHNLTTEYEEIEGQIRANSPRYAALMQPVPLSLHEIQQQVLDENTLLLEYMLGDDRGYVWAVTRTEVSCFELPGRAQIENAARRFYKLLTANQPVPGETFEQRQARVAEANAHISEEAAAFSKLVLGPVMTKLGNKRLLIVPDGALQYIPFQALVVPGKAGSSDASAQSQTGAGSEEQIPLIVDHEIVNEPSASALALVISETSRRNPAPKTIAVLANPVFEADDPRVKSKGSVETQVANLSQQTEVKEAFRDAGFGEGLRIPPLPASRDEANAIMAMAPWGTGFKAEGFEASRATITRPELGQYRIVHFATHGFVDYEHPELSGLVLSLVDEKGNPQDGFLRMYDIYNLKLPADLVVLSACNTGLGKEVKGEGLIGLTRGFMYAGAAGVAASLWKVDDEATAELMKRFYEGMFQKGLTPAAALREAQLGMWRQKRWHAPYYWAAFVIQGQYNQKENMNLGPTRTVKWAAALGGLAAAVSLVLFFLLRQRRRRIL